MRCPISAAPGGARRRSRGPAPALAASDAVAAVAYCCHVVTAVVATGVVLVIAFIAVGLAWTAHLVRIGNLDAMALAEKLSVPEPVSALDWPELHVRAAVEQPGEPSRVLLSVEWPARPQHAATLLVALDRADQQSMVWLSQWCTTQASVSPTRRGDAELELRRRQSLERVHGFLLAEDIVPRLRPGPSALAG